MQGCHKQSSLNVYELYRVHFPAGGTVAKQKFGKIIFICVFGKDVCEGGKGSIRSYGKNKKLSLRRLRL